MEKVEHPWSLDIDEIRLALDCDSSAGLDTAEAAKRLGESGSNTITEFKKISFFGILLEELKDPLIIVTILIGVVYSVWGQIGTRSLFFVSFYLSRSWRSILSLKPRKV